MKEIKRIENWESGEIDCLKCGKSIRLMFNGGELDYSECCGLVYKQKHRQIDLVVLGAEDD